MTSDTHRLVVEVTKDRDIQDGREIWVGIDLNGAGSSAGETLPQFFAETEFHKHFSLGVPKDVPVEVEYVAGQPEIADELRDAHTAFLALPPHLRPQAVAWDHDNDRPVNPAHTGPYLNLDASATA